MAKWLLIDGFNLAYRSFHAVPALSRKDGFPTNALHGWIKTLWRLLDQECPDACVVFFDLGGAQDRLNLLPEYKAQRAEMPEALRRQIEPLKTITRALGLVGFEREGIESDDLLAAQAVAVAAEGGDVLIASSDKDFAQLVNERIKILSPPPPGRAKEGWRTMDSVAVTEKFGVPPAQIADLLALVGDSADNIPGLDGVGPKTAARWLAVHGSLEGVLAHATSLEPERLRPVVTEHVPDLRRNLRLTTLNTALPRPVATVQPVRANELFGLLAEYEMHSASAEARRRYAQLELF